MSAEDLYRRVVVSIWTRLAGLTPAAIVLLFRLRTGPETTQIPGLVVAGRAGLAEALTWMPKRLDAAARELETRKLIVVDWSTRVIWLPGVVAETPPANPSMVVGWRSVWAQIPSCALRDAIRAALWQAAGARGDAYRHALSAAIGDEPGGPPTVPGTVRDTVPDTVPDTVRDTGGGGGSGSGGGERRGDRPPLAAADPEVDLEPDRIEVITSAYRDHFGANPIWDRRDLERYTPQLAAEAPKVLAEIATMFFAADGKRPGDSFWRDGGWTLHLLVTQGLPVLRARALASIRYRETAGTRPRHWNDDYG